MVQGKEFSPESLRSLLIATASAAIEGRVTVQQANAVASLSSEVHKSLKMEYVGQMITSNQLSIDGGQIKEALELRTVA